MYTDPPADLTIPFVVICIACGLLLILSYMAFKRAEQYRSLARAQKSDLRICHGALAEVRATFERYAEIHMAKNSPEGDKKAHSNREWAKVCDAALKQTGYREVGPLQQAFLNMGRQLERQRQQARSL